VQHGVAELAFVLQFCALNRRELRKHFVLGFWVVRVRIRVVAIRITHCRPAYVLLQLSDLLIRHLVFNQKLFRRHLVFRALLLNFLFWLRSLVL
jgi:hypothetical protein